MSALQAEPGRRGDSAAAIAAAPVSGVADSSQNLALVVFRAHTSGIHSRPNRTTIRREPEAIRGYRRAASATSIVPVPGALARRVARPFTTSVCGFPAHSLRSEPLQRPRRDLVPDRTKTAPGSEAIRSVLVLSEESPGRRDNLDPPGRGWINVLSNAPSRMNSATATRSGSVNIATTGPIALPRATTGRGRDSPGSGAHLAWITETSVTSTDLPPTHMALVILRRQRIRCRVSDACRRQRLCRASQ